MTRRRLDAELVRRGLAGSQTEARAIVEAGRVTVGGRPSSTPATLVAPHEPVALVAERRAGGVSRGAGKLDAGLVRFDVDPAGRDCLDAGASTGGFTDRLLRGGARCVLAVDVGYGQLAWELRTDPRVVVLERTNVRDLRREDLPVLPDLIVADLSFVSLAGLARTLVGLCAPASDLVLLVKPQFEAPRADVGPGGVVHDPDVWRRAIESVAAALRACDARPLGVMASPLPGPAGNVEFLLHATTRAARAGPLEGIEAAIADGEVLRA
jgi:23S rRNA (cytidine1920-2'-O)/16S rRNA (cytidine1409-2'-O)-methyltransferase